MILAVCFRRSAFRAHFSPREIVCLPTAMIFAGKSAGIVSGVSFLPVSPFGGMVLRMGRGVTRFSSGVTCIVTLPDFRRGRRGGATLPRCSSGTTRGSDSAYSRQGRRAALPGSRGEVCVKQRVPLSRPSASARAAFPSLFDCGSCRAMTHVISSIGLQKLT